MSIRFQIESHAVDRYIERHAPHLPYETARSLLVEHANEHGPTKLKEKTNAGDDLWRLDGLGVLLVVKPRPENGFNVAVTCIPHLTQSNLTDREIEMIEEYRDRVAAREKELRETKLAREKGFATHATPTHKQEVERINLTRVTQKEEFDQKLRLLQLEHKMAITQLNELRGVINADAQKRIARKVRTVLRLAIGYLVAHVQDPDALYVFNLIHRIDPQYLRQDFYEGKD